ncbi:MAG: putative sporulation protein YtxC [Clostridia bacterium]|nr:putative sporulation protein YtxC [Clostridia bacterium]
MNERIQLGFRNEKALINERILSEREFPIEIKADLKERIIVLFVGEDKVFDEFLSALADYIINRYEIRILKRILSKSYGELKPFQLKGILENLLQLEDDPKLCRRKRHEVIKKGLYCYFKENKMANVEGLVTFRLKEYEALLTHVSERILDIYLMHKEYEEFVGLLRYFVGVQNDRVKLVHIVVKRHKMYTILNELGEDITNECISDFVSPDDISGDNFDDLLISILITLAPEKVIVHNGEEINNQELFTTIGSVFDKVEYCKGCNLCKAKAKCRT